jgi:hypothetical protein
MAAPPPANWQSKVSDPLEKTTVHVADPAPPGTATVNVDVPVASTVLFWKNPFWGVQAQLSEQALWTTVQLVGPVMKLVHWAEDPAVSSDMA